MQRDNCCVMYGCRYVYDYATLKEACELPEVSYVHIVKDIVVSASITPTAHTHIIGFGGVLLDWNGAAWGILFNLSNDHITLEKIRFSATGNIYHAHRLGNYHKFIDVDYAAANAQVMEAGDYSYFTRCWISSNHYVDDNYISYTDCYFNGLSLNIRGGLGARFTICRMAISSQVVVYGSSAYPTDRDLVFNTCSWRGTPSVSCLKFHRVNASTIRNVKFHGCLFEPLNNTVPCILVSDNADLIVEDVLYHGCTFRDASAAYEIPNGTQKRWRLNNGVYRSVADIYKFTGGTQEDFVYTNDG